MQLRRLVLATVVALSLGIQAREATLFKSVQGEVPVWLRPDQVGSDPALKAGESELLLLVDSKGDLLQVRTNKGILGWVRAGMVARYDGKSGQAMDLGEQKLDGHLDNPNSIYILDESKDPPEALVIHRDLTSFVVDAVIDREQLEMKYGENF